MEIKLVSWTKEPLKTICWAFLNMHNPVPSSLDKLDMSLQEQEELFKLIIKQPHTTVLEFVNTVWYLGGVSRAFQQQLTRTRQAAYSIQSLRVVSKRGFAEKNEYVVSNVVKSDPEKHKIYRECMERIQHMYEDLVDCGIPNQDARNLLPLGIYSPITMAINLRSLYHTLELRTCLNAQEEYRNVALLMKKEIAEKMGEIFTIPIHPPCEAEGVDWCPSPVWCGRNDKKPRIKFEDIKKWIKG